MCAMLFSIFDLVVRKSANRSIMPKRPATSSEAAAPKRAKLHPFQIEAAKSQFEAHMSDLMVDATHLGIFDMLGLAVLHNVNIVIVWAGFFGGLVIVEPRGGRNTHNGSYESCVSSQF